MSVSASPHPPLLPAPAAVLTLLKPITWFPPMWAFTCGVVSAGAPFLVNLPVILAGIVLAGPLVCGMSQAANDWCDRHVDAINEPDRPIPSGAVPGRWGLYIALSMSGLALLLGWALGIWAFVATVLAVAAAWAYSAEPVRLKRNGWWSALVCGLSYETLPWFTGAAILTAAFPDWKIVMIAVLYGLGAHGIMTLNDFKAIEGDRAHGLRSLPVQLGPDRAARIAVIFMLVPQALVVALHIGWGTTWAAWAVGLSMLGQAGLAVRFLGNPTKHDVWFSGFAVLLYVLGMMTTAVALRGLIGGA
jgi:chlorophyll synthase